MKRINRHVSTWFVTIFIYIVLVAMTDVANKLTLFVLTVLICFPVIAWWKTGDFTYWPALQTQPPPSEFRSRKTYEHRHTEQPQRKRDTPKSYDLSDIPYPPKRSNASSLKCLPQSNGISPRPTVNQPNVAQCAILTKRTTQPSKVKAIPVIGSTGDLFESETSMVDTSDDILIVPDGDVFL